MVKHFLTTLAVVILAAWTAAAHAQEGNPNAWIGTTGDWAEPSNWSVFGVPDGELFDEHAIVSNGGVATVSSVVVEKAGQVILGYELGETGSLIIANGGHLTTVDMPTTSGEVNVGYNGTGMLTVQPGGRLDVDTNLHIAGEAGSTAVFGGTGAGATIVNVGFTGFFGRNARVIGPNVNFSANGINLQGGNTLTAQITAATHSPLKSANSATLGGTLRLEFTGVTPTLGSKWSIVDAPSFTGQFAALDTSAAPALPLGQVYEVSTAASPGSVNGMLASVSVVQRLVLNVNRQTGAVSIATGPGAVAIDGYSIRSGKGGLNPANWNSLQDQGVSDWRESPQNGSVNDLTELKPTLTTTITQATPRALGTPFRYPAATEFGTEWEDIEFEYYTPDGTVQGIINYIGTKRHNNFVLVVDPATGNAQIQNQSNLSASIDGYQITSASGSLQPANGKWLSLDDNNREGGDWRESNPTINQLVELKADGASTISSGSLLDMGQLFKTVANGGTQDLVFEYLFPGESEFRQGAVVFGALASPSLAADFNNDNVVNALDLGVWRSSFSANSPNADADGDGDSDGRDLLMWQRQLGMSISPATVTATAIPEPIAIVMAATLSVPVISFARRMPRRRTC